MLSENPKLHYSKFIDSCIYFRKYCYVSNFVRVPLWSENFLASENHILARPTNTPLLVHKNGSVERERTARISTGRGAEANERLHEIIFQLGVQMFRWLCQRLHLQQLDLQGNILHFQVFRKVPKALRESWPKIPGAKVCTSTSYIKICQTS